MHHAHIPVALFAGTLALFTFGGAACSDTPVAGLEDVVYEGGTSDEALAAMQAIPSKAAARPLGFSAPAADAKLPASPPATFAWGELKTGRAPTPRPAPRGVRLFGGGPALAHGAALNGKAYLLTFSTASNARVLRVFTSATTYTPSAEAWKKVVDARAPVTVKLESAVFDNNAIAQDGGPFLERSVTFQVAP